MTTTPDDAIPTPSGRILADLRAVAVEPSLSTTSWFYAADRQVALLQPMLPIPATRLPAHLADLIPSILVEYIDNLPVPGTVFWGNDHWHIHVRAADPAEAQAFTVLHELKHIIDHPLRRQPNLPDNTDWEALADYFATQVLAQETRSDHDSATKNKRANENIPADPRHSPSQPTAKTGGAR